VAVGNNENPDIVQTRTLFRIAKEIRETLALDWSRLYAQEEDSIIELRDKTIDHVATGVTQELMDTCPNLVAYLLKFPNPYNGEWGSIAVAIDNLNGMYHPLRLTKVVLGAAK
jgi:hypothetical protein